MFSEAARCVAGAPTGAPFATHREIAVKRNIKNAATSLKPPQPGHYWTEQSAWYAGPVAMPDGTVIALLLPFLRHLGKHSWGECEKAVSGATSLHDGKANTAAMAAAGSPAAKAVLSHNPDWYLPSRIESLQLFAAFGNAMGFGDFWTSEQDSNLCAWYQHADYGHQCVAIKSVERWVVPVRRVVLHRPAKVTFAQEGGAA